MPDEQILAWLKAKERLTDAEEALSEMLDDAERAVQSLKERPSTPFDPNSWPDAKALSATLKERDDAQRALDEADAALSPRDRKLLKHLTD